MILFNFRDIHATLHLSHESCYGRFSVTTIADGLVQYSEYHSDVLARTDNAQEFFTKIKLLTKDDSMHLNLILFITYLANPFSFI